MGEPDADGTLVLSPVSGHYVQVVEPDLVAWAVRREVIPDTGRRLSLTNTNAVARLRTLRAL